MRSRLFALIFSCLFSLNCWSDVGDELRRLVPDVPVSNQDFGDALDVAGNVVLVGAEDTPIGNIPSAGKAFLFDATTGEQLLEFETDDRPATRAFGSAVVTDGVNFLIGAEDDSNVRGAAYLFDLTGNRVTNWWRAMEQLDTSLARRLGSADPLQPCLHRA